MAIAAGLDASGNGNNWTSNNLTQSDLMVDSPTNNFCTWNPLDSYLTPVLSEGNLKFQMNNSRCRGTIASQVDGKIYFEVYNPTLVSNTNVHHMGLGSISLDINNASNMETASGGGAVVFTYANANARTITARQNGSTLATVTLPNQFAAGDIIAFASDSSTGKVWMAQNNSWLKANGSFDGTNALSSSNYLFQLATGHELTPLLMPLSATPSTIGVLNCGQDSSFAGAKTPQGNQDSNGIGDFFYPVPNSYLALCTSNLPSVDVIPSEHFQTRLITGTGASNTQVITGFPFAPDFVWIKNRSSAYNHAVYDTVRGASNRLYSNLTNAEASNAALSAFSSEGYTVGTDAANENNVVSWNWKAGGSASSNTNGSITSSVSANPSAGFSIVSYTGTSAASATIGHSLSQKPELIMVKKRDEVGNWIVFTETTGKDNKLNLNETTASATSALFNNVAPTSTVFSVKDTSTDDTFGVGHTYIAYAFHSVDGYSKVGSYTGNGSADGPFVNLGFKPALIIVKNASTTGSWRMYDRSRSGYNPNNNTLYAEGSYSEDATVGRIDLLSNGFKIRIAGTNNASGVTVTFLAFAETPFKFSNAR
jgi:hypothetical protein